MEHRWSSRKSIDFEVMVNLSGIGIIKGRACNISLEGMLLETGRLTLCRGDVVELDCIAPDASEAGISRFRAQVVHSRNGKAGLIRVDGGSNLRLYNGLTTQPGAPAGDSVADDIGVAGGVADARQDSLRRRPSRRRNRSGT